MKVIYRIQLHCGSMSAACENEYDTDLVPDKNTKCLVTENGDTLYPHDVEISGFQNAVIVSFKKKFWWWQEKRFWQYYQSLKDIPIVV